MSSFWRHILVSLALLTGFLLLQKALQNPEIYRATGARVLLNYERSGSWDAPVITKDTIDYRSISNDNLNTWDAAIYDCIRRYGYRPVAACYESFKASFFPAFPYLWRFTGLDFRGISLFNYLLFTISLGGLMLWLGPKDKEAWQASLLSLSFPAAIVYALPYSESLFLALGLASAYWAVRAKPFYFGLFFGLLLLVRPAVLFISVATLLSAILWAYHQGRRLWQLPLFWAGLLGQSLALALILGLHYYQARSFLAYFEATAITESFLKWPWPISDWSFESFGLSSSALFLVMLPAGVFSLRLLFWARFWRQADAYRLVDATAVFYAGGLALFWLLQSGGSTHSLHRFIFSSPAFWWLLFRARQSITWTYPQILAALLLGLGLSLLLVLSSDYGGHRLVPEFWGLLLVPGSLALWFWLVKSKTWYRPLVVLVWTVIGIWWATYLQNQMLSNAWIFT